MPPTLPILVATDLSAAADEAIRQADQRACAAGAPLVVCHVLPNLQPSTPLFPQQQQAADMAQPALRERALTAIAERVDALVRRRGDEIQIHLLDDAPAEAIVALASEVDAQLVVVGSSGEGGLQHMLLGGVAEHVVREAHCPVLVARSHEPTHRILVATDFSDPAMPAVAAAAVESRRPGTRVTIVHAVDFSPVLADPSLALGAGGAAVEPALIEEVDAEIEQRLAASLAAHDIKGDCTVVQGPATVAITDTAERIGADLLIVGTHGATGFRRLMLGSVAEAVVRNAPCSVLVVRLHPVP